MRCGSLISSVLRNAISRLFCLKACMFQERLDGSYGDFEIIILIVGMNCIRCGKGANLRCRSSCFQVVRENACGHCLMSYIPSNFFVF